MYKWGLKNSPVCVYCCHTDTIVHHLFECENVKTFWTDIESWIFYKLGVKFRLTVCEIIFGICDSNDFTRVLNYIIIFGKVYINKQRTNDAKLTVMEFIGKLQNKVKVLLTLDRINQDRGDASTLFELLTR